MNGRQFIQLLQLAPGTVPVSVSQTAVPQLGSAGSNVTPSINGGSGRSNLFFVDGLYATDPFFTSLSISPAVDAIREFQEQTHTDEAQFGGSIGATVNLATKGGTNQFHGSAYEFFRNQDIAATSYFAPVKGAYEQNQFGGSFGGPIIKNKLFFFGYYDGYRQTQAANNFSILPTTAELGGDFSALLPNTIIYDPATYDPTTGQSQPFPGNIIPAESPQSGHPCGLEGLCSNTYIQRAQCEQFCEHRQQHEQSGSIQRARRLQHRPKGFYVGAMVCERKHQRGPGTASG